MSIIKIIGIILIVLGVVGLVYGGISYTYRKDAVDMGPMHLQVDENKHIPISPIVGAAAAVVGVILLFARRRGHSGVNAI